jgi:hypothetical protein
VPLQTWACRLTQSTEATTRDFSGKQHAAQMKSYIKKSSGITLIELLMEWVVPIVGGVLTLSILHHFGCRSRWWICLALPGSMAFQWSLVLLLLAVDRLFWQRSRQRERKR